MKSKTTLTGILTTLALLAVLSVGMLTAGGCVSRADWEVGLDQAQEISDTLGNEIGSARQLIADLQGELADAEPGSQFAADLRRTLDQAQDKLAKLHQQKAPVDGKILEYQQRLAEVPEGASDIDTTLYMLQKGYEDAEGLIPIPTPVKEGIAVGSLALLYYLRRKFAKVRSERDEATEIAEAEREKKVKVVTGLEVAKRKNPDFAGAFHSAGGDIQMVLGPDLAREVNAIRKGA